MFSLLRSRTVKKRMIVIGLKDDNSSREVLLRLLNMVVMVGDSVLAVHVQELDGCEFDPNTFHIHEDLCKSKQVRTNRIFYLLVININCYFWSLEKHFLIPVAGGFPSKGLYRKLIHGCAEPSSTDKFCNNSCPWMQQLSVILNFVLSLQVINLTILLQTRHSNS